MVIMTSYKDYQTMCQIGFPMVRPLVISRRINYITFRLYLPPQLLLHLVFHNSLLEPCQVSSIPNRTTPAPPPIEL